MADFLFQPSYVILKINFSATDVAMTCQVLAFFLKLYCGTVNLLISSS